MKSKIAEILEKHETDLLTDWLKEQSASTSRRSDLMKDTEVREQSTQFLKLFRESARKDLDPQGAAFVPVREYLGGISRSRALQGFSPSQTAMFVFSLKQPLFGRLRKEIDGAHIADELWTATTVLDGLGLYTTEVYQKSRDEIVSRQAEELLELSTPVVKLWDGILALPMIGTLDSSRTQTVMENLLQRIVETGSEIAIIDITGVPTVDTLTAQHLLKTVTATRLMGADCIISGVRPQIAQTLVHLGVNLGDVTTKATLAAAFAVALQRIGLTVGRPVAARKA